MSGETRIAKRKANRPAVTMSAMAAGSMSGLWNTVVGVWLLAGGAAWAQPPAAPAADPLAGFIRPIEWLRQQPRPKFREGHTLPPLTRAGWSLANDANIEFAGHWGYCLQLGGGYFNDAVADRLLNDPQDPDGQLIALAATDPKKYRLAVGTSRELPPYDKAPPEAFARDADGRLLTGQATSQDGTTWSKGMEAVISPAAPDSFWKESGRLQAAPLRRLAARCPIAVVLNFGEYGLASAAWGWKIWEKDPVILKDGNNRGWAKYGSQAQGRSQKLIADVIRGAVPDALYIFYAAGGSGQRNRYGWWDMHEPHYEDSRGTCSLPTAQMYFKDFNSGWLGDSDMPTMLLNARGQEIAGGEPLGYYWLCGGYKELSPGDYCSDIRRYTGFLRFAYTAGMIGANAGYYTYPDYGGPEQGAPTYVRGRRGFDGRFPPADPPNWLEQMVALARVHAQFSHLEHYLRQGDLLAGPFVHCWSTDQPAYELLPVELAAAAESVHPLATRAVNASGWERTDLDVSGWKTVDLPNTGPALIERVGGYEKCTGTVWFRRTVDLPAALQGRDLVLKLGPCDDNDVTYWNGEKIGATLGREKPREYRIPADKAKGGKAVIAVCVEDYGGGGNVGDAGAPADMVLAGVDGAAPIPLAGPWHYAVAWAVLADKDKPPRHTFLAPGRPVRVVARKLRDKPQWLITAWATDGQDREIRVPVPELGEVAIRATAAASVYEATLADGKPVVKPATEGQ